MLNVLFVCTKNQWRSRTAETIFKTSTEFVARSAGTASNARIQVSATLIEWADVIFVMEKKHQEIVEEKFANSLQGKHIRNLNIPDGYKYMDPELITLLEAVVAELLIQLQ